jgi:DsbE subfamily thiol:disulfide oxidoreductase
MSKRGWIILGGGVPVLALIALLAWASIRSGGNPGGLAVNSDFVEAEVDASAARDFELQLIGGGSLKLSDLRGKVVMVDFWASWCPPCRVEAPTLAKVYREFRGQPVEFVGVDLWDNVGDAEVYLKQEGLTYPNGFDAAGIIAIDYGVRGIPEKYFIGQDGVIAKKLSGPLTETVLRDTINELLGR